MPVTLRRSRAARELDKVLDEDGPTAKAIRREFHRTSLWRLRTGRRQGELDSAKLIEKKSRGRIRATWWREDVRQG